LALGHRPWGAYGFILGVEEPEFYDALAGLPILVISSGFRTAGVFSCVKQLLVIMESCMWSSYPWC
jgi:hypothetical protein